MYCGNCRYYDDSTGFCSRDDCVAEEMENAKEYAEEMKADAEREEY